MRVMASNRHDWESCTTMPSIEIGHRSDFENMQTSTRSKTLLSAMAFLAFTNEPAHAYIETATVCNRHPEKIFVALRVDIGNESRTETRSVSSGDCIEVYVDSDGKRIDGVYIAARTFSGRQQWGTG